MKEGEISEEFNARWTSLMRQLMMLLLLLCSLLISVKQNWISHCCCV